MLAPGKKRRSRFAARGKKENPDDYYGASTAARYRYKTPMRRRVIKICFILLKAKSRQNP